MSADAVIDSPYNSNSSDAMIPVRRPATLNNNRSDLFFGEVFNDVIELVIPLIIDGINVGTVISN